MPRYFLLAQNFQKPAPALLAGAGLLFIFVIFFWQTLVDLVTIWNTNDTYSHGFFIPLLTIFLLAQKNTLLANSSLKPAPLLILPLAFLLFIWLLANISDTKIIELLTIPLILITAYSTVIGYKAGIIVSLPLMFLYMATPVWSVLIPYLQAMAVVFNEFALQISGFPTFIEGHNVSIPAGDFVIEDGCSGIRYFVVTLTLGTFYALLNFTKLKPIAIIISLSVIFSLVLNWIRIYLIILIGHFSDMQSSIIEDHHMFGWLLYGAGLIPFFIFIQRSTKNREKIEETTWNVSSNKSIPKLYLVLTISLIVSFSLSSSFLKNRELQKAYTITNPMAKEPWVGPIPFNNWQPDYLGGSITKDLLYIGSDKTTDISFHIYYYGEQKKGAELINESNTISGNARVKSRKSIAVDQQPVIESIIAIPNNKNRLVWHWYYVNDQLLTKPILVKLHQSKELISGKSSSALIALSAECENQCEEEKSDLKLFIQQHKKQFYTSLQM